MLEDVEKLWEKLERAKNKNNLPGSKLKVQVSFDRDVATLKIFDNIGQIELNKADLEALKGFLSENLF